MTTLRRRNSSGESAPERSASTAFATPAISDAEIGSVRSEAFVI
ncbi:MAG: hypothetical protein HW377_1831 [Actinobacteria bacterium]|nr:hypothetical protein [Actinomycetota bacterium]